jgi:hypothetical protein
MNDKVMRDIMRENSKWKGAMPDNCKVFRLPLNNVQYELLYEEHEITHDRVIETAGFSTSHEIRYITHVEWRIKVPKHYFVTDHLIQDQKQDQVDNIFGIWESDCNMQILCAGNQIFQSKLFDNPMLRMLTIGKQFKALIREDVTHYHFVFPYYFDMFQNGNVFPLGVYAETNFQITLIRKPKYSEINYTAQCAIRYASDDYEIPKNQAFKYDPLQSALEGVKCIYELRHITSHLHGHETEIELDISKHRSCPVFGIYFQLLGSTPHQIKLTYYGIETVIDPMMIKGTTNQFNLPTKQERAQTKIDISNTKSPIFPIEIWEIIFKHLTNPARLIQTCKALLRISKQPTIQKIIGPPLIPDWYFISFNQNKLFDYKIEDCIIFPVADRNKLKLEFAPGATIINMTTIHYNILMQSGGLYVLRYSI